MLSVQQSRLKVKHAMAGPRRTRKWCTICGGLHSGVCTLKQTSRGTFCRPEILAAVEDT